MSIDPSEKFVPNLTGWTSIERRLPAEGRTVFVYNHEHDMVYMAAIINDEIIGQYWKSLDPLKISTPVDRREIMVWMPKHKFMKRLRRV